jgi:tetratricopeptide (TPR) repeat protein
VRGLLELGLIGEVDARIAAATDPRDGVAWTTMRALLDGREDAARAGVEALAAHARATDDAAVWERYWIQRFWVAVEWGTVPERYDLLDHCRERAYRFDELGWWGDLTLLLATVGNTDEAARAFDVALALLGSQAKDDAWLDAATNLVEAAALLGDASRAGLVHGRVVWPEGRMVVVGPAIVCKGSIDRYRALGLAALGRWAEADECFRAAAAAHREIGAGPLLARTLRQADRARAAA